MTQSATDKLIAEGIEPISVSSHTADFTLTLTRDNPCAVYANALKVAVEALDYIQFGTCDCTQCVEMCQCHENKAQEALAEINRIAENKGE